MDENATTLSGRSMVPVIAAASLGSFLMTPVRLIRTRRPRRHHPRDGGRARPAGRAGSPDAEGSGR